jgi:hypothetical protein
LALQRSEQGDTHDLSGVNYPVRVTTITLAGFS